MVVSKNIYYQLIWGLMAGGGCTWRKTIPQATNSFSSFACIHSYHSLTNILSIKCPCSILSHLKNKTKQKNSTLINNNNVVCHKQPVRLYSRCTELMRSLYLLRISLLSPGSLSSSCRSAGPRVEPPSSASLCCGSPFFRPTEPFCRGASSSPPPLVLFMFG